MLLTVSISSAEVELQLVGCGVQQFGLFAVIALPHPLCFVGNGRLVGSLALQDGVEGLVYLEYAHYLLGLERQQSSHVEHLGGLAHHGVGRKCEVEFEDYDEHNGRYVRRIVDRTIVALERGSGLHAFVEQSGVAEPSHLLESLDVARETFGVVGIQRPEPLERRSGAFFECAHLFVYGTGRYV